MAVLAQGSSRPRYAFMLLNLIAEVADGKGSAGPLVRTQSGFVPLRDWLSDTLAHMAMRDPKRRARFAEVESELRKTGRLPADDAVARRMIETEVIEQVRASGKTNLSRAVSELVRAGLLRRHYEGYRVDHQNRGAQRQAVYSLAGAALLLLRSEPASRPEPRQRDLFSH